MTINATFLYTIDTAGSGQVQSCSVTWGSVHGVGLQGAWVEWIDCRAHGSRLAVMRAACLWLGGLACLQSSKASKPGARHMPRALQTASRTFPHYPLHTLQR